MDKYAYEVGDSLYLNITNRCSNHCTFCVRYKTDVFNKNYSLWIKHEPTFEEMKDLVSNPKMFKEIVFCGYGEPLARLELFLQLARFIKDRGGIIRLDTNGQGNIINKKNIVPLLAGLVDSVSISLNAHNAKTYDLLCHSVYGENAYFAIIDFAKEAKKYIKKVTLTVVNISAVVHIDECKKIADDLGVNFRVREYYEEEYPEEEKFLEK